MHRQSDEYFFKLTNTLAYFDLIINHGSFYSLERGRYEETEIGREGQREGQRETEREVQRE